MKNLILLFSLLFSCTVYGQINERTEPTELKKLNNSSQNTSGEIKISSSNKVESESSNQLIIKKYLDARKNAGKAMKVYDKTVFPPYNHNLTEEQNIRELINWGYNNIDLFKEEYHEKIKEYYNNY